MNYLDRKILGFFVKTNGYFSRMFFSGIGHILTLHRVIPQSSFTIPENKALEITPDYLEFLIQFYRKHNYEFASLDTLYDVLSRKEKKRKKLVILTFDDGYSDVYDYAYPLLKSHDVHLNLYLTSSFPDKTATMWWYALEELFHNRNEVIFQLNESYKLKCKHIEEKQETFKKIRNIIIDNYIEHIDILTDIFKQNGLLFKEINKKITEKHALRWEQITEMSTNPLVCIGAHTVSHPILNKLTLEKVEEEVVNSKKNIEAHIQKEVCHFAYPHGGKEEVGQREFDILKRLPLKTSVTTRYSNIFAAHRKHLECLPRVYINKSMNEEKLFNLISGITQFNKNKYNRIVTV